MKQNKLHSLMDKLKQQSCKVVEVTKDHYVLENGNVFEHTFSIDDDFTVEQFQHLLDKAKDMVLQTLEKIDYSIMSLLASFSGKFYGRRSAERRKKK